MNKLVLSIVVVLSCLMSSTTILSATQNEEMTLSEREVIIRGQLAQTKVRSLVYYDVLATKDAGLATILVEFEYSSQFLISITDKSKILYEKHIIIQQDDNEKEIGISIADLEIGNYTLTIKDQASGKIISGNFIIK